MSICDQCGHNQIVASCKCNNRHCPSCGATKRKEWLKKFSERNFATSNFHAVFTLPHELNSIIQQFPSQLLALLCKEAANTLMEFAQDPKYLGGTPFLTTVLHTWTQDLRYHPHVHCLISGGAISQNMDKWIEPKNKDFLFPVKALSKKFKGAFISGLKTLINEGKVVLPPQFRNPSGTIDFLSILPKKWLVYCKPPYKGKDVVLKYFARYTNRAGISDNRIEEINDNEILIKLKRDPAEINTNGAKKTVTLTKIEFFKRFFTHVLPKSFHRIRHFGLSSPRCSKENVESAKKLLNQDSCPEKESPILENMFCPKCQSKNTRIISSRPSKFGRIRIQIDTS